MSQSFKWPLKRYREYGKGSNYYWMAPASDFRIGNTCSVPGHSDRMFSTWPKNKADILRRIQLGVADLTEELRLKIASK